ncbi:MAG: hypothetical protein CVV64_02235 [Candidatus Wallbacteria bacterium HGW-Wallbacteria-1]|jgi:carbohydrate-binding DOMON domain-containing protein|uniref:Glucodextranase-like C-terminal domain-containing protein n=1 Tax=Candidatus Wallbacteria bacterium HGW-Wallbacteria-1 TaxID=2013854 RepID=A0A2N1PV91_9BACT|nr:MAG: hypothetical protein CVV64_02235 [Candidatus Wallbacteria bacterium HGW-Wallbacteria-1]
MVVPSHAVKVILLLLLIHSISGCIHDDAMTTTVDVEGNRGYKYSLKFLKEKKEAVEKSEVLFSTLDPVGDDKGPGTYQYPMMDNFERGAFDITYFEVSRNGNTLVFNIGVFGRIKRGMLVERFSEGEKVPTRKWKLQLFDIYIDKDRIPGSGEIRTLPGRSVTFDENYAWDQVIIVSPKPSRQVFDLIKEKSEIIALSNMEAKIAVPDNITVSDNRFSIRIPIETIGEPQPNWAWQIFAMGYDEFDTSENFMNKTIHAFSDNWGFGGGSDFLGDPNVMDIITPKGVDQYKILSNYVSNPDPKRNRYAVIPMVTKDTAQ